MRVRCGLCVCAHNVTPKHARTLTLVVGVGIAVAVEGVAFAESLPRVVGGFLTACEFFLNENILSNLCKHQDFSTNTAVLCVNSSLHSACVSGELMLCESTSLLPSDQTTPAQREHPKTQSVNIRLLCRLTKKLLLQ